MTESGTIAAGGVSSERPDADDGGRHGAGERGFTVQSEVLARLVSGATIEEVLDLLVRSIETSLPGMRVSILFLDPETMTLGRGIAPSMPDAWCDAVEGLPAQAGVGCCGSVAATGVRTITTDVTVDEAWRDFAPLARDAGIRSCWSEPIRSTSGTTLGTFAMYFDVPRAPTAVEIELIEGSAHVAGIAIEHVEARTQRDEASAQLEYSRNQVARLLAATTDLQLATTERDVIDRIADAVHDAGWASVVVCLFHPDWTLSDMACVGVDPEDECFMREHQPEPRQRAGMYGAEFEPYRRSRSYFLTGDEVRERDDKRAFLETPADQRRDGEWDACDIAYTPLFGRDGLVLGTISLDGPDDGQRPTATTFRYLELFADLASRTIENLRLLEERRRGHEHLALMMRELDHRVRNNLVALQGLIAVSATSGATVDTFKRAIAGRVGVMAEVHALLSHGHWTPIPILSVLQAVVPSESRNALVCDGAPFVVGSRQVGALGMVIHELVTNSQKYGAFGRNGRVEMSWTRRGGLIEWTWRERVDDPAPASTHEGAGSRLIKGLVSAELGGEATLAFPDGRADHRFTLTLDPVADGSGGAPRIES